jgi:molybdenum cofactor synthesis domain-containing protein
MNPSIETFAIGTELAIGQIQDTNSSWMAQEIARMGGEPRRLTILVDSLDEIVGALRESVDRKTEIILITGGLGPTPDDMTVEAVCKMTGQESKISEPIVEDYIVRRDYKSRDEVSEGLLNMATVPVDSEPMPNPAGWAPCIKLKFEDTLIFMMPGPPRELKGVFQAYLEPFLNDQFQTITKTRRIWTDMYESQVSPYMEKVMSEFEGTYIKAYVALRSDERKAMPVDIVCHGEDEASAIRNLDAATHRFRELVESENCRFEVDEPEAESIEV